METRLLNEEFKSGIDSAIQKGSDIVFISYSVLEDTEEKIKYALTKILEKFKREDLFTPLYSCTKELISNATKANAKEILVHEGIIKNPDDPFEVIQKIRTILNEKALHEYGIKAKENRLSTRTYFKIDGDKLIIEVINNLPLSDKELKRIIDRIEKSSGYESIADFYLENPDPVAEGMGLGLSMIVVLLKSMEINYKNFVFKTDKKSKTYAKLYIPLN
jgi:hypothetical protein